MSAGSTPIVDLVIGRDGPYADERELALAAIADGLNPAEAAELVADFTRHRDEEWAREHAAEAWAEGAWLRAAEAGDEDTREDLRRHNAAFPDGYR